MITCYDRSNMHQKLAKNKEDIIGVLEKRPYLQQLKERSSWNEKKFVDDANRGNYIRCLVRIWQSKDLPTDLERLGSNSLHAPLLFECALIAFERAPIDGKAEVVKNVSLPLIAKGSFRVFQDAQCALDPSVKANAQKLVDIYEGRLKDLIKRFTCSDNITPSYGFRPEVAHNAYLEIAKQSMTSPLPSPNWIGESGKWVKFKNVEPFKERSGLNMKAECAHDAIRRRYAENMIKRFSREQESMVDDT